jgi:hypothetical protein
VAEDVGTADDPWCLGQQQNRTIADQRIAGACMSYAVAGQEFPEELAIPHDDGNPCEKGGAEKWIFSKYVTRKSA